MKYLKTLAMIFVSLFILISCQPAYKTTTEKCKTNQNESVLANFTTFKVNVDSEGNVVSAPGNKVITDLNGNRREVDANNNFVTDKLNEYRLYLQDLFTAMKASIPLTDSSKISAAEKTATLNAIIAKFNTQMPYTLANGVIKSSDNPIDFIEYLITSTKDSEIIQAFVDAKRIMAKGIKDNDGFCIYTNRNINLNKVTLDGQGNVATTVEQLFAELRMTFDPFNQFFSQNIIMTQQQNDLIDLTKRTQTPFVGFYEAAPDNFKAQGFSHPKTRFASMNNAALTETFTIDDGFDSKLGQIEFTTFNTFCTITNTDGSKSTTTCSSGPTHTISKTQCTGGSVDFKGNAIPSEVGKMQQRTIDLLASNPDLQKIQRFRVETDYAKNEVRVYVSKYVEAILDADNVQQIGVSNVIFNPTACEKQAVLDELAVIKNLNSTSNGVRLTVSPDPGYDITYQLDSSGNRKKDINGKDIIIEPTPVFSYTGTQITSRK